MSQRRLLGYVVLLAFLMLAPFSRPAFAGQGAAGELQAAHTMFYNGRYADAAVAAGMLCTPHVEALTACELQTAALHFQIRRLMGDGPDKEKAFEQCAACPELLSTFVDAIRRGQATARARLQEAPEDEVALFFLGKFDLNYVWLNLATIGRKTGWNEYREARRSIDRVLKLNPGNVRAKVARAWIDYIVDTRAPFGTKWILGGGNKKRGLQAVRDASAIAAEPFVRAEALFALWDMQVREKNIPEALTAAQALARDFPANPEIRKFIDTHTGTSTN